MKTATFAAFALLLSCAAFARAEEAARPAAPPASPAATAAPISPAAGGGTGEADIAFDVFAKAHAVCTVSTVCPNGGPTLSCSGSTCSGNSTSVTCDGSTRSCGCTAHCPNNPSFGSCTSSSGVCSSGFDEDLLKFFYSCDGIEHVCPDCPNHQFHC